ncbi:MAG: hypothetical protein KAW41_00830 [Candidatus Diapherotrites archaeon]|nr:hypothetical protein [Candidatus Diapherotrites archaeon]
MLSLALLIVPGLVLYSRMRKEFSLAELVAASIALSMVVLPFAAMLARPMGLAPVVPLGFFVAYLLYRKGGRLTIGKRDKMALAVGLVFALLVALVLLQYAGPAVHPTHAGDAVWHMSNAEWYRLSPQFPPEDSYTPGHTINGNWLFTVLLGEAGMAAIPLAALALFLSVYLVGEKLFRSGMRAGALFMLLAGGSWVLGTGFQEIIFAPLGFKFDPTLLFFFLPQPQAIGLGLMAFALFLFLKKQDKLLGVTLAVLAGYHLQTAAVLVGAILLHHAINRKKPRFLPWMALGIPFLLPLLSVSGSHMAFGFRPEALPTIALTVLPLGALAWRNRKTELLALLSWLGIALALFVAIPLTQNGYRFLVYAALPLAVLASPRLDNAPRVLIAGLLCISSVALVGVYTGNQYGQAAPSELAALEWARENTPQDAIFLEEWSLFPRVPYLAHRRILYGGHYGVQYHGLDNRGVVKQITGESDGGRLRELLLENNVDYVFVGEREKKLGFYPALAQFEEVYPGVIRVS